MYGIISRFNVFIMKILYLTNFELDIFFTIHGRIIEVVETLMKPFLLDIPGPEVAQAIICGFEYVIFKTLQPSWDETNTEDTKDTKITNESTILQKRKAELLQQLLEQQTKLFEHYCSDGKWSDRKPKKGHEILRLTHLKILNVLFEQLDFTKVRESSGAGDEGDVCFSS